MWVIVQDSTSIFGGFEDQSTAETYGEHHFEVGTFEAVPISDFLTELGFDWFEV